jgi:putative DNA primase/helicase
LDKVALLQEYMGLSLTSITQYQKMMWLIGEGSNGKSVVLDIVRDMVGSENCSSVPFSGFAGRFNLEQLQDKLVNIDPDMSISALFAPSVDAKIKSIVGGDWISLERKGKPVFQAKLVAKLWAGTNCMPTSKDQSHGFFRRVLILQFNRIITEAEQDKFLTQKLRTELPGIFNWALEGLKRLQHNQDFTYPLSSKQAVDDYKLQHNPVAMFRKLRLREIDMQGSPSRHGTLTSTTYSAFKKFCDEQGLRYVALHVFGRELSKLGIKSTKANCKQYYPVTVCDVDELEESPSIQPPIPIRSRTFKNRFASENLVA